MQPLFPAHYFRILEIDEPDQSDPLNQFSIIGWKAILPWDDIQLGEAWKNKPGNGLDTASLAMLLRNAAWKLTIYSWKQKLRKIFRKNP